MWPLAQVATGRVRDARVVDARKQRDERLFDPREVAQSQITFVELALFEALVDDALDQLLDGLARVVARGAGGGLGAIGEHQDGSFTRLWPRAGVGE